MLTQKSNEFFLQNLNKTRTKRSVMPKLIVDGSKINYHEVGAGERIILLHCSSSSHRQWKNLWNALKKKYHVIAIDLLGWGETDAWRKDRDDLLASEASIVSKIIGSAEDKIHLIGHSYGGTIAFYFAMMHADRIKSLTLIEPMLGSMLDPRKNSVEYEELHSVAKYFWENHSRGQAEKGIQKYFDYWNGVGAWLGLDEKLASYVLAGADKNFYEFQVIFDERLGRFNIENFKKPVLLLGGKKSTFPPLKILEMLDKRFPRSEKILIDGASHMSPITHWEHVNTIIKRFISLNLF